MKSTNWGRAVPFLALPAKIKVRTVRLKGQARTGQGKGCKKYPKVRKAPKAAASIPPRKAQGEGIKKIPPTETALRIRLNPNS